MAGRQRRSVQAVSRATRGVRGKRTQKASIKRLTTFVRGEDFGFCIQGVCVRVCVFKLLSEGLRMIVTQMPARGMPTSGLRLLTSRTQTPAGSEGSPTVAAPGRVREDRAPGRAGTVSPAGGRSTERGETSQQQANSGLSLSAS